MEGQGTQREGQKEVDGQSPSPLDPQPRPPVFATGASPALGLLHSAESERGMRVLEVDMGALNRGLEKAIASARLSGRPAGDVGLVAAAAAGAGIASPAISSC
nr:uncharacterized protein LOC127317096 [Lolium perenne]XP_051217076.1 uncharacterized protein LOC127334616 [Lolium perenne]